MDTVGMIASGGEADQYFCTQAPSGSGPWHRGVLAPQDPILTLIAATLSGLAYLPKYE